VELLGTHLSLRFGPWRLRFSIAIEDADIASAASGETFEAPRLVPADKINHFYPNRR
jgi:hypothetical protein